jgi:ATP-binding cassette subfamily C (CFTR/MRP) protein 1
MATMQLIVAGLAVVLVALSTQLKSNAGLTGASLVTLLNFGQTIAYLIVFYTALETSIGAVSRLRTFSLLVRPEDQPGEDVEPPEDWPHAGRIDIKDVSASYDAQVVAGDEVEMEEPSESNLVAKDLNLTIEPGQKVAICGRTGSGKSSLILLLLRLLEPLPICAKNMEIDGIPFHKIDRTTLRKRIIAIPQDAVFLPDGSSIKSNIDPLGEALDDECLDTLRAVRLAGFVADKGGLEGGMSADDLSAGQKQLFSLGRAILRKRVRDRTSTKREKHGGILLLDEVSSSVDKVTDRAMQEIIRDEFAMYTIVMVSHRLEMVMDFFDRVIVLDQGSLVESGSPRALVDIPGSRFGELWALGNHDTTN